MLCSPDETLPVQRLIAKVHSSAQTSNKTPALRTLSLDRTLLSRLKPRITLAANIVTASSSKAKTHSEESWLRKAAEDLGVDYDNEEFEGTGGGRQGRGNKRKQKEREDRGVSKQEVGAWRAELKALLAARVNTGVSPKYFTGGLGGVDIHALLKGVDGEFLGAVAPIDMLDGDSD